MRSIYAAWERGDFGSTEWAHPEIEYVVPDGPSPGSWTGLDGMAKGSREVFGVWEDWRSEAEEYLKLDDERVLVLTRFRGRGKTSGLELGQLSRGGAFLFHISDDRVSRFVSYWDRDRALADRGRAPEGGSS